MLHIESYRYTQAHRYVAAKLPRKLAKIRGIYKRISDISGISESSVRRYCQQGQVPRKTVKAAKEIPAAINQICREEGIDRDASGLSPAETQRNIVRRRAYFSILNILDVLDARDMEKLENVAYALYKTEHPNEVHFYDFAAPDLEPPDFFYIACSDDMTDEEIDDELDKQICDRTQQWKEWFIDAKSSASKYISIERDHESLCEAARDCAPALDAEPAHISWRTVDEEIVQDDMLGLDNLLAWEESWPLDLRDDADCIREYSQLIAQIKLEESKKQKDR